MTEGKEMTEDKVCRGIVLWFDARRGFGFLRQEDSETDIFVHFSNIDIEGFKTVKPNQIVTYTIGQNHHGPQAENVVIIGELDDPEQDDEE